MFWKLTSLSAASPVETVLDKEDFTLEELLDEDEIIQECKALNTRLINFLRDSAQVDQLLRYIVEEPPADAENKQTFKFPFIACEVFTCEIDVILKTLVEEEELMNLLFSFLEPNRTHSALLAGYFSKVVVCLMIRKTVPLMNYVQAHQDIFRKLVDLIGITSIMEVLVRLVGADDHMYPNFIDVMQWLAESDLLEMIVDKLSPSIIAEPFTFDNRVTAHLNISRREPKMGNITYWKNPPEVHANAAETLSAITRNAPSALATKLSSPSFFTRIFDHALEDSPSESCLVNSLSVCISLLDPKKSAASSPLFHSFRGQHMYESPIPVSPDTVSAMLPKLGDLLTLLNVTSDEKVLPTAYGELRPPLGKHRLKVVEFIAVLLRSGNEDAEKELVSSGTIQRVIDLFFEYAFNNSLHHHVNSIILSCLESKNDAIVDHLLQECDLVGKFLQTDKHPLVSGETNKPTLPAAGKKTPRAGNLGHITRISNKLIQLGNSHSRVQACLQENSEWIEWQATVLQQRNAVENVNRWACGRPTSLQDRTRDSDDEDMNDRDYDVAQLANNLSQDFRYKIYGNEDAGEEHGALDRDDEDVYFDDESAEVVVSSLRLGDDHGSSLFTNSNWFAFQDDRNTSMDTSPSDVIDDVNLSGTVNGGNSSSDDEVVVGEDDELGGDKDSANLNPVGENASAARDDIGLFRFESADNEDLFGDEPLPEWVSWGDSSDLQVGGASVNPFEDHNDSDAQSSTQSVLVIPDTSLPSSGGESIQPNGSSTSTTNTSSEGSDCSDTTHRSAVVPSLFEEDVEFVGVELEGTEKAMNHALKEGIVGEAGPLKKNITSVVTQRETSDEDGSSIKEFNDANYWRVDQEVAVLE